MTKGQVLHTYTLDEYLSLVDALGLLTGAFSAFYRRLVIFKHDNMRCVKCRKQITHVVIHRLNTGAEHSSTPKFSVKPSFYFMDRFGRMIEATIDHVQPQSKHGSKKDLKNLQTMCSRCNQQKADKVWMNL